MRSVVLTATLVTILWLGFPGQVAAQEPDPPPPPPPPAAAPRDVAVPRSERVTTREPQTRTREAGDENRAPARGADRAPVREPQSANDGGSRREAAATSQAEQQRRAPVNAATTASVDEEQRGAQRRGAVRRPSGDESRGGSQPRDRAVARTDAPRRNDPVYVYPSYRTYNRYYDPWGYGAFGLGYFYYSPWAWNPGYYGYGGGYGAQGGQYSAYGYDLGSVKIKVKPQDAEVFVDNYFAGSVDDFDGFFQALKLDSGGYRIEVRKPGYETLRFDVRVQPDRTVTFRGEMKPLP